MPSVPCKKICQKILCQATHSHNGLSQLYSRQFHIMSKNPRIERKTDNTIIVHNSEQHRSTVFFFHGLGDSGNGWLSAVQDLSSSLPHTKWILPTAPTQPVTVNLGMAMPSWYDITSLQGSRTSNAAEGIEESRQRVLEFIKDEVENCGLDHKKIVLAGFSQGGALSLYTGLQMDHRIGGVLVLSGYMPREEAFKLSKNAKNCPLLHCHGECDPVIQPQWATLTHEILEDQGHSSECRTLLWYPGIGHSTCESELQDAVVWLRMRLSGDAPSEIEKEVNRFSVQELKSALRTLAINDVCVEKNEMKQAICGRLRATSNL